MYNSNTLMQKSVGPGSYKGYGRPGAQKFFVEREGPA